MRPPALEEADDGVPSEAAPMAEGAVTMTAAGVVADQTFEVREDPRIDVDATTRRAWTETLLELWTMADEARETTKEEKEGGGSSRESTSFGTHSRVMSKPKTPIQSSTPTPQ